MSRSNWKLLGVVLVAGPALHAVAEAQDATSRVAAHGEAAVATTAVVASPSSAARTRRTVHVTVTLTREEMLDDPFGDERPHASATAPSHPAAESDEHATEAPAHSEAGAPDPAAHPTAAPTRAAPPTRTAPVTRTAPATHTAPVTRPSSTHPTKTRSPAPTRSAPPVAAPVPPVPTPTSERSNAGLRAIDAIKSGTLRNSNTPRDPLNWGKWCRALVRTAFRKATGRDMPELASGHTAWDSYRAFEREGLVRHGGTPPAGAIVFWSPAERARLAPGSPGATAGHVAISNGDGTVISNVRRGGPLDTLHEGIGTSVPIEKFGTPAGYVVVGR